MEDNKSLVEWASLNEELVSFAREASSFPYCAAKQTGSSAVADQHHRNAAVRRSIVHNKGVRKRIPAPDVP